MNKTITELKKRIEELENQKSILLERNTELCNNLNKNENSEKKYSVLINSVNIGIILLDENGFLIGSNIKSSEILNLSTEHLKDTKFSSFLSNEWKKSGYVIQNW